ncbi:Tryptophan-rich protein TspO [Gracilariopsis chorda]|uniref:Tryptophan-rich protein TspO n=1 Tax=Gracilariopsis chorda TaxID=448386 RepID=A0A2V3IU00_9FLOR|nr:Tryptophan-rich protein TspO [Gracilariopsis chorda]|eukprot:PXF44590.1 Tryptophan-rich protein TspO [Gracilariopsis chorda]
MEQPNAPLLTALLFGPFLLGVLQMLALEPRARSWHTTLRKWPYRPPGVVHPVMWTWSYLSIGYASYLFYTSASSRPSLLLNAALYGVHMALLNSWGLVFYHLRRIDVACKIMLMLDVVVALSLPALATAHTLPAVLCVPYLCWLLMLTYMNWYMMVHNEHATHMSASKQQLLAQHRAPLRHSKPHLT